MITKTQLLMIWIRRTFNQELLSTMAKIRHLVDITVSEDDEKTDIRNLWGNWSL